MTTISIIIPTYNEGESIGKLVRHLKACGQSSMVDLIVSDGGSTDNTFKEATEAGAHVVISPQKGRAAQMNFGATLARGEVLYFVHADSFPPATFITDIQLAIQQGYDLGRYRTRFASSKSILKLNAWFTRFDLFMCMGGDQTLFITQKLYSQCGGFNSELMIMEDYEFCKRARAVGRYRILPAAALISARKYDTNSWWTVQRANATVVQMYKRGASQQQLLVTYKQMLSYRANAI